MTKYVMNRKDFRVLINNSSFDANPNYVEVSDADAVAVMKGEKTGARVLKELLYSERTEELRGLTEGGIGAVVETVIETETDVPKTLPTELARSDGTVEPANPLAGMKVKDLLALAVERGINFEPGTTKAQMIEQLSRT
jgi:hypothetical protein